MKKICLITSRLYFVEVFLIHQIRRLSELYEVTVIVDSSPLDFFSKKNIRATLLPLPIERKISPLNDLITLFQLIITFRHHRFDIIHSFTPKAGLLSMMAGFFCRTPLRIHTFTGQVWATRTGFMRWMLKLADKLIAHLATRILIDSTSQRNYLIQEHIISPEKSQVLAHGSISGFDPERFRPNAIYRENLRKEYGIPDDEIIFLYMARLNRDKGALVMAEGFSVFSRVNNNSAHLFVVGTDEENLKGMITKLCSNCIERVHFVDYTTEPEKYYASADIFCLPSYREGFGTVLINAAAVGIPSIASRIYGCEDAVIDGVTGLLHEVGDVNDFVEKMNQLAHNKQLRSTLWHNGMIRARRDFSEELVTNALINFYQEVQSTYND